MGLHARNISAGNRYRLWLIETHVQGPRKRTRLRQNIDDVIPLTSPSMTLGKRSFLITKHSAILKERKTRVPCENLLRTCMEKHVQLLVINKTIYCWHSERTSPDFLLLQLAVVSFIVVRFYDVPGKRTIKVGFLFSQPYWFFRQVPHKIVQL